MTAEAVREIESTPLSLRQTAEETQALLRRELLRAPAPVREVTEHLAKSLGKGIRTLLLAACAMDDGGGVPRVAVNGAASIELLHMATLVHDDIIDDAATRRGLPAVHSQFGRERAVLGGDWLLCRAMAQAAEIVYAGDENRSLAPLLIRSAERVCLGELSQRAQNGNLDLTTGAYLRIIDKKTAALFYLSAQAGTLLGGRDERETKLLLRFARYLGLIFQMVDDVKDYAMDERDTLKPVKNDLLSGVVTMPLIISLMREPSLRPLALDVMRSGTGVHELVARVQAARGVEDTLSIARTYGDKALALLARVPSPDKRAALEGLLHAALLAAKSF